ncbi:MULTISPECIES: glutamate-5-semialdehyde dehydrogenase [unclassified Thermosynechococcus]|uniref:glutamate-5-semialdehyde dehydrogenase n=1 Tax=unclassified Thermosynechococcus TaxID=2622553 RepID=UPI0019D9683F|nr:MULTISPECIES: glutamate-5-semialdehyde dehydrogenase [unclassified Thermosynechococcus]HIK35969.1 glutamate-5-semialdehyde dehydrogenase [Thermosynechococcus sp. M98_K2018_005]HIK48648.1 glutamate-5-semialdehyde dehydrogenase [Thermosynechococcus sp. M55_K2018_012]
MTDSPLVQRVKEVHEQARLLATLDATARNDALEQVACALEEAREEILAANAADCEQAKANQLNPSLYARLELSPSKLAAAIAGVRQVAALADPLGQRQLHRELDTGLVLSRVTCPLGVLGVIFEARPDAVVQIASLAIKSGNGAILKGGQEARRSCQAIMQAIHRGLEKSAVPAGAIALLMRRAEITELLQLDQWVDLIIPRGSNEFVRYIQNNTQIPVLGHADGLCHLYVDVAADLEKAIAITLDAKTQYPAACNAIETLLVHRGIAEAFLPKVAAALEKAGVELRGDEIACHLVPMTLASEADWAAEYCDLILSIKVVPDLDAALDHIATYGSGHTEAIVTEDAAAAARFLQEVDAASVFHNCSTRFADGFRYGFGAEVGISTHKLPPRGPVGLEGLVTYKYQLVGNGHIVATYSGPNAKPFTHRDLAS